MIGAVNAASNFARAARCRSRHPGCATPPSGLGVRLLHLLRDRCRDGVEMAGVKEGRAVPQLHCAVAGNSRTTSPIAQEIDLASAGEIEGDCGRRARLPQRLRQVYRAGTAAAHRYDAAGATTRCRSTSTMNQKRVMIRTPFGRVGDNNRNTRNREVVSQAARPHRAAGLPMAAKGHQRTWATRRVSRPSQSRRRPGAARQPTPSGQADEFTLQPS
jgi:hypothetical protein